MPGRDGTGPMGRGAISGRGLGPCTGANAVKYGFGYGPGLGLGFRCGRGVGRGLGRGFKTEKETLQVQRDLLQSRLKVIDEQLENM